MKSLILYEKPPIKDGDLLVGFGGWPNAGEVSTRTILSLRTKLKAKKFGEIEPYEFYDLTSLRPTVEIRSGEIKKLFLPKNELFYSKEPPVILLLGVEPQLGWKKFSQIILKIAKDTKTKRIITIGGTLDRVHHLSPTLITAVVNEKELKKELWGLRYIEYEGPSSFHTFLLKEAKREKIKAISLWAHTPVYIRGYNPKTCYDTLRKLEELLNIELDLEDIKRVSEMFEKEIDRAVKEKPELLEFVKSIEEPPEIDSTEIIREIEEFLRKKDGENKSDIP